MSNNALYNQDCPPLMYSRGFTDYRPNCVVNSLIANANGLNNAYDYKEFLIHRGQEVRNRETQFWQGKNSCASCNFYYPDPNKQIPYWSRYDQKIGFHHN